MRLHAFFHCVSRYRSTHDASVEGCVLLKTTLLCRGHVPPRITFHRSEAPEGDADDGLLIYFFCCMYEMPTRHESFCHSAIAAAEGYLVFTRLYEATDQHIYYYNNYL